MSRGVTPSPRPVFTLISRQLPDRYFLCQEIEVTATPFSVHMLSNELVQHRGDVAGHCAHVHFLRVERGREC